MLACREMGLVPLKSMLALDIRLPSKVPSFTLNLRLKSLLMDRMCCRLYHTQSFTPAYARMCDRQSQRVKDQTHAYSMKAELAHCRLRTCNDINACAHLATGTYATSQFQPLSKLCCHFLMQQQVADESAVRGLLP